MNATSQKLLPIWVYLLTPIVAVGLLAAGLITGRALNQNDSLNARLTRQNITIRNLTKSVDTLSKSQNQLLDILGDRRSNAQHVICTEERLVALVPPLVAYTQDLKDAAARDAFLKRVADLQEGIDGDGVDDCPPLPIDR